MGAGLNIYGGKQSSASPFNFLATSTSRFFGGIFDGSYDSSVTKSSRFFGSASPPEAIATDCGSLLLDVGAVVDEVETLKPSG